MSEKLRTKLAGPRLSNQQMRALKCEVIEALTPYSSDQGISFPAELTIVAGRKQFPTGHYVK